MNKQKLFQLIGKRVKRHRKTNNALRLQTGEMVEVRNENEILLTLDKEGTYEGLPFTPEMREYCGRKLRVLKRVDKILVEGIGMRSLKNAVILDGVICGGEFHDGCQRTCLLLWKEQWLKRSEKVIESLQGARTDS